MMYAERVYIPPTTPPSCQLETILEIKEETDISFYSPALGNFNSIAMHRWRKQGGTRGIVPPPPLKLTSSLFSLLISSGLH